MARGDFYDSAFGATYSTYMERFWLSRLVARAIWGGDVRPYYESMRAIAGAVPDSTIVDCPCGAGAAFRALEPGKEVRYVGVDLSPSMLRRARKRAAKCGLEQIELVQADATEVPLPSGCANLFLSYWGLHCFPDPAAALREAARILKPGGRLVGSTFVKGDDTLRQRLLVRPGSGDFGTVGTAEQVTEWLEEGGFSDLAIRHSGPMMFFEARRTG
ncbi:MAG: class I SAM-dependent methyltransferase [Solirubrobacterales bacterium]